MQVTQNAFGSAPSLWNYNAFTRSFAAWRHPGLRSVREHREKAKRYWLAPCFYGCKWLIDHLQAPQTYTRETLGRYAFSWVRSAIRFDAVRNQCYQENWWRSLSWLPGECNYRYRPCGVVHRRNYYLSSHLWSLYSSGIYRATKARAEGAWRRSHDEGKCFQAGQVGLFYPRIAKME